LLYRHLRHSCSCFPRFALHFQDRAKVRSAPGPLMIRLYL
jgi:hypothetical protein